jgi:hypothetical protein
VHFIRATLGKLKYQVGYGKKKKTYDAAKENLKLSRAEHAINTNFHFKEIAMIDEKFDTRAAAEEKAKEVNEHCPTQHFCPLINAQCRKDCQCWAPARVRDERSFPYEKEGPLYAKGFHCTNGMFSLHRITEERASGGHLF